MRDPAEIEKPRQLLVEGKDQQHFFEEFLKHIGREKLVQVQDYGGGTELRGFLPAFVKMPGFNSVSSIGIIRDAESSAQSTFQSVQSSLRNVNLAVPTQVEVATASTPTVAVLILPGGGRNGMLETVLCELFAGDAIDKCIDEFFNCAGSQAGVAITKPAKSRAFAYLALTRKPYHSVGVAAQAGVWDLNHCAFANVSAFLRNL